MNHIYIDAMTGKTIDAPTLRGKYFFVGDMNKQIRFDYVDNVLVTEYCYYHFITMQFVKES